MGLIAQRLSETRFDREAWLNDDAGEDGGPTVAGVTVTRRSALSVSTVFRSVDILSSAVGDAPRDVNLSIRGQTFPEYSNVPGWIDQPDPSRPALTARDYFKQLAASYLFDGNYFVRAWPDVYAPVALRPLEPERVRVKEATSGPGPLLEVLDSRGHVAETLRPDQYLHGKWFVFPGELRGVSILEIMRRAIGGSIAAEEYAHRYFGQGAALSFGVEVPGIMTEEQKTSLRESLRQRHQGNRNAHNVGVLTAGAKFVGGLGPTPEQAQMLETRKFSVEEIARWFGVPPYMVGSQEPGAASYASSEVAKETFAERVVLPLASAIEDQHNRLLTDSPVPGGRMQFKLNLDGLLRANLQARYDAYEKGVRSGVLKPNEARGKENLGPVPGGDTLYMQAQMTPIDQLGRDPTPDVTPARAEPVEPAEVRATIVVPQPEAMAEAMQEAADDRHTELVAAFNRLADAVLSRPEPVVNVAAPIVNVPPFPAQVAPVVNVSPPVVNVPAAVVRVDTAPLAAVVADLRERPSRKTVKRDAAGRITSVVEEPLP